MTNLPNSQGFIQYEEFNLNVTTRTEGYPVEKLALITELTIKLWVWCARQILGGIREVSFPDSPLDKAEMDFEFSEPHCTVWGDVQNRQGLTVHSHTYAQQALNVYWARYDALAKLGVFDAKPIPQANAPQNATNTPSSAIAGQLDADVIIGKMNPRSTQIYYADGQLVALPINRFVLAYHEGWIYEAWGTNGNGQYPALKIFKNKKGKDENSAAFVALKSFLEGLALNPDTKQSADGSWWLIGKIAHVDDKEYFNPVEVRVR